MLIRYKGFYEIYQTFVGVRNSYVFGGVGSNNLFVFGD